MRDASPADILQRGLERSETETAAPAQRRAGWLWPVAALVLGVAAATMALIHLR